MINKLKQVYKNIVRKLPYVKDIYREYSNNHIVMPFPPGHFYNPVNNFNEINKNKDRIFKFRNLPSAIDLNRQEQFDLLSGLLPFYAELPFPQNLLKGSNYYLNNNFYTGADAVFTYLMLRQLKPKNIIEVGSGFSSALMLETSQQFLNNAINFKFIEPFPERLLSLLKQSDNYSLEQKKVQDIPLIDFKLLEANDILFIDSSHIIKTGSDVNYILFEVLPALNPGVYIHFHDIFYPFEYPEKWILGDKLSWNEIYALRTFLMYNHAYKIALFNSYLISEEKTWFDKNMPLCTDSSAITGSIWLKKL